MYEKGDYSYALFFGHLTLVPYFGKADTKNKKSSWRELLIERYHQGTYPGLFSRLPGLEKLLKAVFTKSEDKTPPFSHNLVYLAEKAGLVLNEEKMELLEEITDFNLEARYPDEKFSFYKKSTKEFTVNKLVGIKEIREWLLQMLQ